MARIRCFDVARARFVYTTGLGAAQAPAPHIKDLSLSTTQKVSAEPEIRPFEPPENYQIKKAAMRLPFFLHQIGPWIAALLASIRPPYGDEIEGCLMAVPGGRGRYRPSPAKPEGSLLAQQTLVMVREGSQLL